MSALSIDISSGSPESAKNRGFALALAGILLVSTDSLIAKAASANGWSVAFWYGALTAPAMLAYYLFSQRAVSRRTVSQHTVARSTESVATNWPWLLVSAALQTVSTTAFILAVKTTAVANVVAIIAALPVLAAVVAWFLLRERTDRRTWLGIAGVILGVGIIVSGSLARDGIKGDLLALLAIVSFAFNLSLWRRFPSLNRVLVIAVGGAITALVASTQAQILGHSAMTYLLLTLMGILLGPVGRIWLASATKYITASEVALFAPVETVAASLWAWLAFSEVPTLTTIVGGAVIIVVVLLTTATGRTAVP